MLDKSEEEGIGVISMIGTICPCCKRNPHTMSLEDLKKHLHTWDLWMVCQSYLDIPVYGKTIDTYYDDLGLLRVVREGSYSPGQIEHIHLFKQICEEVKEWESLLADKEDELMSRKCETRKDKQKRKGKLEEFM
jgi:hypothetical protein